MSSQPNSEAANLIDEGMQATKRARLALRSSDLAAANQHAGDASRALSRAQEVLTLKEAALSKTIGLALGSLLDVRSEISRAEQDREEADSQKQAADNLRKKHHPYSG